MSEISWEEFIQRRTDLPIIDVRSSLEFDRGHVPQAHNIPLLNNKERARVGTAYKQKGKIEAVKTGFRLVGPRLEEIIIEAEKKSQKKELLSYCWRGGMRSASFCQFMEMAGIKTHYLKGGYQTYKAKAFDFFKSPCHLILLSGYTGSGKSELLRALDSKGAQVIDLEKLANHKGSVFGGLGMPPQPTTEQFRNLLFEKLLTFDLSKPIWIEDESISIGKVFIPDDFWKLMRNSPIVLCQLNKSIRINRLVQEYGSINITEFHAAITKIAKKLGPQHFKKAIDQLAQNNMHDVMETLLIYYDKTYRYNLEKRLPKKRYTLNWEGKDPHLAANELLKTRERMEIKINL